MADFSQLKAAVANVIKTNGNEEITGAILQDVLLTIINSIAGGYMFGGVAEHSGNVGNPDYNVFYLAGSGSYTGYGGAITIENGCYGVFRYNGTWHQEVVDIGVRLSGSIVAGETRGVTGDTINTALQALFDNVMNILDSLTFTYNTPSAQQATKAMIDVIMTPTGGAPHVLTTLTLASATVAAAGLMSAEDKQKVDRMLTDFRSLSLTDTTAAADQATKIVQTLSATLGENPEAITTFTLLAATASKAGLMSAADKSYLDSLPAVITGINGAISDNLARVLAMMGYYECSTAAGTAAKEVSASGYSLTSGGCIRIKMTNANTANDVTLNINSTGAKALYYDGVQASASNTWEAGEVLEVYYDGTQYQCASGGGGKFATGEKVKEVSITDTLNNTSALVESGAVFKVIGGDGTSEVPLDMSQVSEINYYPNIPNGKWIVYNGYKSKIVPVPAGVTKIKVTAQSSYLATVVLLKSGTAPSSNNTPIDYADSNSGYSITAGTTQEITLPSNCTHLGVGTYTSVSNVPTIICSIVEAIIPQIQGIKTRLDGIDDEIDDINEEITISDLINPAETFDNLMFDDGSLSTNSATKDKYISKKYALADGVAYKITSKVRGSGYHQLVFKDANGNVTGLINEVTQEVVLQTVIDSNNIPANSVYVFVNGYVYDGSTIEARLDVPVKDLAVLVPDIAIDVEELNGTVFGTETHEEEIPPTEVKQNGSSNKRVDIDYRGTIKNGDRIVFNGGTSYVAYIGITNTAGSAFEKNYTNGGYVNSLDIVYDDGDSRYIRFLVKRTDDAVITVDEVVANTTYQILRTVGSNGLMADVEELKNDKPSIKALFIGNSVCQDHVAYLPWLLKNTFGNDINFEIYLAYKGGATIKQYVTEIITGTTPLDIFSHAVNTESWTNASNFAYADIWTLYGPFDLICFEGYFNNGTSSAGQVEDTSYFMPYINDLKSRQQEPFKLGYLIHQTYTTSTHTEADAWARIIGGAGFAIHDTPVSILFPCGVVTKLVNGDIPQATLTNDNIHNQQGLPCIMGAYTLMEELTRYMGLPSMILNNPLRITSEIETSLNIPGPNGSLQVGTEQQYSLCQDAAVKAVKYGDWLMIENSDILNP